MAEKGVRLEISHEHQNLMNEIKEQMSLLNGMLVQSARMGLKVDVTCNPFEVTSGQDGVPPVRASLIGASVTVNL